MHNDDQRKWNILSLVLFAAFLVFALGVLKEFGRPMRFIGFFEMAVLALAAFRLTRLFVYDIVMQWFRDLFLIREVYGEDEHGEPQISRRKPPYGWKRTAADLLHCPWCFGMWAAFTVLFAYLLTPYAIFIIYGLALAALGSFLQIIANWLGHQAEEKRIEVERM